jgi:hypothetical protein
LQEKNAHEHQRVTRYGLRCGIVDIVELGPALDIQDKRTHAPVQFTVALEQVRIAYAIVIVEIEIAVDPIEAIVKLDDWHFCIDEIESTYEARTPFRSKQFNSRSIVLYRN